MLLVWCPGCVVRVLTIADPNAAGNQVVYNYKDREFVTVPPGPLDNIVFHFAMDGCALHKVRVRMHGSQSCV